MALIVTSCTLEKRVHRKGYYVSFYQIKKAKRSNHHLSTSLGVIDSTSQAFVDNKDSSSFIFKEKVIYASVVVKPPIMVKKKLAVKDVKHLKYKKIMIDEKLNNNEEEKREEVVKKTKRKYGILTGVGLLLMAVFAGIAIPVLGTLTASLGLIGIFLLDLLVAITIFKFHKVENLKLSKITSALRLLYTFILGIAVGFHIGGNVSMFNYIWGVGLITFGFHLISLGILFKNAKGKKWLNILIKSLLITGGIGYVIQYIGVLLVVNPLTFTAFVEPIFIIPMILGEVFYAFWMLLKGGK